MKRTIFDIRKKRKKSRLFLIGTTMEPPACTYDQFRSQIEKYASIYFLIHHDAVDFFEDSFTSEKEFTSIKELCFKLARLLFIKMAGQIYHEIVKVGIEFDASIYYQSCLSVAIKYINDFPFDWLESPPPHLWDYEINLIMRASSQIPTLLASI